MWLPFMCYNSINWDGGLLFMKRKLNGILALVTAASLLGTAGVKANTVELSAVKNMDLNNDGIIDIMDLAQAARDYNRVKEETNWNAASDINNDGIIDIYDLVMVSKAIGTIPASSLSLSKTSEMIIGESVILKATVLPADASNKNVTWKSSEPSIAVVDSTGKVTGVSKGTAVITAATEDGSKTAACYVTVTDKGYVNNPELSVDLRVRASHSVNGHILGYLYNYEKVEILDFIADSSNQGWYKISYKGSFGYVSKAYIRLYSSPPDSVADIAVSITRQFEVGSKDQIAGNFDGQGLSLGYLQWCIGQGTLQPLLHRMDRQYNSEMKSIFGTNYDALRNMLIDTSKEALPNQLQWAVNINDSKDKIVEPWYSQFVALTKNQNFIEIEKDAEAYSIWQAMMICDRYNLKTVRGFALAFDIAVQNGSISPEAAVIIDTALKQTPDITEKNLLGIIASAVSANSTDVASRKQAIVNGQGTVHGETLNLDSRFGLSDARWR
jgi:hypothetical protein